MSTVIKSNDLCYLTIAEASAGLRRKDYSPVDLTEACLERIEALDGKLHSFITITAERARAQARQAEQEFASGKGRGPLHGIPIALKDLYMTKGIRTTCHSAVLEKWVPDYDATAVLKLEEAGTILLGKLGMHEFAFGGPSVDAPFPGGAQSVEYCTHSRRFEQRLRGRARCGILLRRARLRHRRLDSYPVGPLWHCRPQANLRPGQPLWRRTAELVAGPRRTDGAKR